MELQTTTHASDCLSVSGQCFNVSLIHSRFSWADDTHGSNRRVGSFPWCISTSRLCSRCLRSFSYISKKHLWSTSDTYTPYLHLFTHPWSYILHVRYYQDHQSPTFEQGRHDQARPSSTYLLLWRKTSVIRRKAQHSGLPAQCSLLETTFQLDCPHSAGCLPPTCQRTQHQSNAARMASSCVSLYLCPHPRPKLTPPPSATPKSK